MVEVTQDFILGVLGAKVVELEALRTQVSQLEQQIRQMLRPEPEPEHNHVTVDDVHAALVRRAGRNEHAAQSDS